MHWCYVSARNRRCGLARVAVMLAQCSRSRVRCEQRRHVRGDGVSTTWSQLILLPLNVLRTI